MGTGAEQRTRTASEWWARRSRSAGIVRIVAAVGPTAASVLSSVAFALLLPPPERPGATLLWWTMVLGAGVITLLAMRSLTVRLAPLAMLLDLALVFPDEAPSRFALARRTRSVDEALRVLEDLDETASVQAAAEASLALVIALENHDRATRGHAERVRVLADLVGQEVDIASSERVQLRWAALLHDLGKLHVHGDILNKPGRPTEDEWAALQRHPLEGDRLVQPLRPWLGDWVNAVVEHHERFDGNGYPYGRAGKEISLAGRIVGVVDAYETMTARRPYKEPRTAEDARRELVACAGSQFDPGIVRAFLSVSIPQPSRRSLLLGWLAQLPVVAWFDRLPRQPTLSMLGIGATTATLVASGLTPAPAPDPMPAHDPPPLAVSEPAEVESPERLRPPGPGRIGPTTAPAAPEDLPDPHTPSTTGASRPSSHAPAPDTADRRTAPRAPRAPAEEAEPTGTSHRRATHVIATALHLGADNASGSRWLPLLTDPPPARDVPDGDHDGRPGVRLPSTADGAASALEPPAWTLRVPTTALVSGRAEATLHLARAQGRQPTEVLVQLLDCPRGLRGCREVARGSATAVVGPVDDGWQEVTVPLGPLTAVVADDRVLTVLVSVPKATGATSLAVGSASTPSRIDGLSLAPRNLLTTADQTSLVG